jgi:mannose-6-phosphate isomerase-like protein (cupin superfamily)
MNALTTGYVVRHERTAPVVPCPCGESARILTAPDGAPGGLHVTSIRDSVLHYHRETHEIYYILEGCGEMQLNDDIIEVSPGAVISIDPGTRHRLWSEEGVRTVVVSIPPFRADDEYFD